MAHAAVASVHTHTYTQTQNGEPSLTNILQMINARRELVHEAAVVESWGRGEGLQVEAVISNTEHIMNTS